MMKIFLFLIFPLSLCSQSNDDLLVRQLQDMRILQSAELSTLLRSDIPRWRELALLAVANIQDTSLFGSTVELLNDNDANVRAMAAFTVGMLGHPRGAGVLFRRLSVERNEKCIAALFNAIGMTGSPEDLKRIINQSEHYPSEWNPFVTQSIYRFANRKIKDPSATKYAVALLDDNASIINAAYALMRINDTLVLKNNNARIRRLMNNTSPLIRMWGSTMLGSLDDAASEKQLIAAAKKDKDWRVRVNAVRALRTKPRVLPDLRTLISDPQEHVALAAAASVDALLSADSVFADSSKYIALLRSSRVLPAAKDEVRKLIAKKMGDRSLRYLSDWNSSSPYSSAQRIKALGETGSERAIPMIKDALQRPAHSLVQIAAIEAYQVIARRAGDEVQKDFLKTAALQFTKNDAGLSYTAAVAFQDTLFSHRFRSIFRSALVSAYNAMKAPKDLEPMVELLNVFAEIGDSTALPAVNRGLAELDNVIRVAAEKAFIAITGEDAPMRIDGKKAVYAPFYSAADLGLLDQYKGAEITTSKGKITMLFEKDAAPFTVLNFILLTKKKFYDGLTFHRVVSNFVVQGGDPLGNGSGGPDHSIRTEVHPAAVYRTGAVGMASAGKDTEGSQWFITHCPTPHLDYRYTIFGYTKGTKVTDKIMIGDMIERVTLFQK
jgi:cyclophilin family peptidyl-prolyl cis-trans isomerase/HEAT repeat protein